MSKKTVVLLLAAIITLAAFFRFYQLDTLPPGLYPDVAMNGNNAIEAWETGNFKVFYPENGGREGLFINLQALFIAVFGKTVLALKIPAAIIGILTVLGTYFLARSLFNAPIGLLSSFFLAVSFWHVHFSRIGFRAIVAPLILVWMLYFLWQALNHGKYRDFIIAGGLMGLGMYTYISFRIIPLAVAAVIILYLYFLKKNTEIIPGRRNILKGSFLFGIAVAIACLPLLYYFYLHPGDFSDRASQVSIFSSSNMVAQFIVNWILTLGMFNIIGDLNWRHNISGAPLLVWPVGIFFIIGFFKNIGSLVTGRFLRDKSTLGQAVLLAVFLISLLPVTLSNEGLPHALRSLMVAPLVMIMAAAGFWWLFKKIPETPKIATPLALSLLVIIAGMEYSRYFIQWARDPSIAESFTQQYVDAANQINQLPLGKDICVVIYANGALINNIPMPAQTVMYLTDTYSQEKQQAKHISYVIEEVNQCDKDSTIIPLY